MRPIVDIRDLRGMDTELLLYSWSYCGSDYSPEELDAIRRELTVRGVEIPRPKTWRSVQGKRTDSSSRGTFATFLTPRIITMLYICVQIAIVIMAIMAMGAPQSANTGVVLVIAVAVSLLWRVICEQAVLFFKMQDTLTSMVGRLDVLITLGRIALDNLDRVAARTEESRQQTRESAPESAGAEDVKQE